MLGILGNYPTVYPQVGAFLRNHIVHFHVRAFQLSLHIEDFSGVNDAYRRLFSDHLVSDLIHHISLYQGLLGNQILHGLIQLLIIHGVHGVAFLLQRHHKGIPDGILHQDFSLQLRIPKIRPFGGVGHAQLIQHSFVIQNAYGSRGIGYHVAISRIELRTHFHIFFSDFLDIGNVLKVDFRQKMVLHHLLNHVIRGANRIIQHSPRLDDRIHFLVGFKHIVNHFDAGFLLKFRNHLRVDILSPVIDIDYIVRLPLALSLRTLCGLRLLRSAGGQKQGAEKKH